MPSNTENFRKHRNEIFVETGSLIGDGVQQALEAGYPEVISIELSDKYFEETKNQAGNYSLRFPTVKVIHGSKRTV